MLLCRTANEALNVTVGSLSTDSREAVTCPVIPPISDITPRCRNGRYEIDFVPASPSREAVLGLQHQEHRMACKITSCEAATTIGIDIGKTAKNRLEECSFRPARC
jgi:hypothetical protein